MRDGAGGGGPKQELWLQREVSNHCFLVSSPEGAVQGSRGSDTSTSLSFVPLSLPPGCAQPPRAQCQAEKGDNQRISSREPNVLIMLQIKYNILIILIILNIIQGPPVCKLSVKLYNPCQVLGPLLSSCLIRKRGTAIFFCLRVGGRTWI